MSNYVIHILVTLRRRKREERMKREEWKIQNYIFESMMKKGRNFEVIKNQKKFFWKSHGFCYMLNYYYYYYYCIIIIIIIFIILWRAKMFE